MCSKSFIFPVILGKIFKNVLMYTNPNMYILLTCHREPKDNFTIHGSLLKHYH